MELKTKGNIIETAWLLQVGYQTKTSEFLSKYNLLASLKYRMCQKSEMLSFFLVEQDTAELTCPINHHFYLDHRVYIGDTTPLYVISVALLRYKTKCNCNYL